MVVSPCGRLSPALFESQGRTATSGYVSVTVRWRTSTMHPPVEISLVHISLGAKESQSTFGAPARFRRSFSQ